MKRYNKDTEEKILLVAQRIFREKGYNGTKTQEIADEAGINKALLHYYFTSKSILFEKVFLGSIEEVFGALGTHLNSPESIIEKTPKMVSSYLQFVSKNSNLFVFVISEAWQNPEFTDKFVKVVLSKIDYKQYVTSFKREIEQGVIKDIDPVQFLINLVSLCIFPFIGTPIIQNVFAKIEVDKKEFFLQRKEVITNTMLAMLKK